MIIIILKPTSTKSVGVNMEVKQMFYYYYHY